MNRYFPDSLSFCWIYILPGIVIGDQIWVSIPNSYNHLDSNLYNSLLFTALILSFLTNAITTMMISYKLWYVTMGEIHWMQQLIVEWYYRSHRKFIAKTLGLRARRSPVQTVLILLVESGFVYLALQVSHFCVSLSAGMRAEDSQSSHRFDR